MVPWRREWLPTPVFLPGEFHGQRSLVGYIPWGRKELDTAEGLTHTHTHTQYALPASPPELWPDLDGWFSTRHFHSNPDLSEKQRRQQREETPARPSSLTPGSTGLGGVGRHRPRWASAMLHQDRGSGGAQTPGGRLLATPDASCELSRALQGLA